MQLEENTFILYLSAGTPIDFETNSDIAFECFLFSSTPREPILINEASAAGSVLAPQEILQPPTIVATQN